MTRPVFVSVRAQEGNLGDLVIRKYVTDLAVNSECELHVLAEGVPAGFLDALQLPAGAVVYESFGGWLGSLIRACLRQKPALVFTPGPQTLSMRLGPVAHQVLSVVLAALLKIAGGDTMKVGRAFSGRARCAIFLEKVLARFSSVFTVRDFASAELLGLSQEAVLPDVAFGSTVDGFISDEGLARISNDRNYVAMAFRGDRPIDREALSGFIATAQGRGFEPVFVTQVRSDETLHKQLSAALGVPIVSWEPSVDHRDQLQRVVAVYQQSVAVVSNRLHGAIFGMQCGAVPVGWQVGSDSKLAKTLVPLGLEKWVFSDQNPPTVHDLLDRSFIAPVLIARKRARLASQDLASRLSGG